MPGRRHGTRQDDPGSVVAPDPEAPDGRSPAAEPAGGPGLAAGELGSGDGTVCPGLEDPDRASFRASVRRAQELSSREAERGGPGDYQLRRAPAHAMDRGDPVASRR